MSHLVRYHAAENADDINVKVGMKLLHSVPKHVPVTAGSIGTQKSHAKGCIAG